jgi:hypothetical protein
MGMTRKRLYQTAGKQNQAQQPGSVRTINHLKPFVHLLGRGQLSMYNKACYRSFDSLVLLLRKFEREKNDLDAVGTERHKCIRGILTVDGSDHR